MDSMIVAREPRDNTARAIFILAAAAFVIVTTEFIIVGLLPALAHDFDLSISTVGQLVTLFAFTVMLFGPPLTAYLSHVDRKRLFLLILLTFTLANTLAAVSSRIWILAVARFVPALVLPVFWGTASDTAARLVGPERAGRAVSQVYFGIAAALVFGIPLGTEASAFLGWRGTFWGLAVLGFLMLLLMWVAMPDVPRSEPLKVSHQARILRDRQFVLHILLSVIVYTAMFCAYTYLADTLQHIAGIDAKRVGWWLMGFGAVGLFGNWLGGRLVDRNPLLSTTVFTLLLGIGMTATVPFSSSHWLLAFALIVWGVSYTALYPVCQVRVMKAAPQAAALAGTLNVSAANAGIALGAVIGGASIHRWGLGSIGYVGTIVALLAILMSLRIKSVVR
jgi:predicted MFS family arabinose efflux permease